MKQKLRSPHIVNPDPAVWAGYYVVDKNRIVRRKALDVSDKMS